MLVIRIDTVRELAIAASLGVGLILLTNLLLLPILLSFLNLPASYQAWAEKRRQRTDRFWRKYCGLFTPGRAAVAIGVSTAVGVWAWNKSAEVRVGDSQAGVPELRQDSRYNQDSRTIISRFSIGIDVITVFAEAGPNASVDYDVVSAMDRLEGRLRNLPTVQSVVSLSSLAKGVNAAWNEGSLKWRVLPRDSSALAQATSPIETATGMLNSDASVMPIMVFLTDHRAETLKSVTQTIEDFIAEHPPEKVRFRLAGGNAGVMAATNDVVQAAQTPIVLWVFGSVIVLCLLVFRSLRATLCIVLPLGLVSYLGYALMVFLDIGLKTATLPVVALGVGIGVDYGIYIFAVLQRELDNGVAFAEALFHAFRDTGGAVVFTGLTLAAGVGTWAVSALKFQADMGVLLSFMFLVNMLAAVLLLPALALWLYRRPSLRSSN
jgi:predicted RND superfamily exporter protein